MGDVTTAHASERQPIAHVRRNIDGTWDAPHMLDEHLESTAALAATFARSFGSEPWAIACAFAHDVGKSTSEWQSYLRNKSGYGDDEAHLETKPGKLDHSTPGAAHAEAVFGKGIGRVLSYCIAGHHAGLPDWIGSGGALSQRLSRANIDSIPTVYREMLESLEKPFPPWRFENNGIDLSLWVRMLFSALVDADFLDTERYMAVENTGERQAYHPLPDLLLSLTDYIAHKVVSASGCSNTTVHEARQQVLFDCLKASEMEPGFFSLTVPTGGGKTLSSMAFALNHAIKYGKERVIYVIPFTSIIEQNADVFREALGRDQVVEHHSNLDDVELTVKSRLAAENWDAPIVVTTSVQFFESLFAAKPSRCRKLHNIANSVIVFDEAQVLPVEFLKPILSSLRLLVDRYRATILMCTATQPALEAKADFPEFPGLPVGSLREIVSDVPGLYRSLTRVRLEPIDTAAVRSPEEIAEELRQHERVLCIVSDRKSCRTLHSLMPMDCFHLSALMCGQHRSDQIRRIRRELEHGGPVRVISTQLVEAGVDLDFPVVYRALAGLDSIAQAAGRCNREGLLNERGTLGTLVVFVPQTKPPIGLLRKASEITIRMIEQGIDNPIDASAFGPYFSELFWKAHSLDAKKIINLLKPQPPELEMQFRSASEAFRIIDDSKQRTVLVPYGEGQDLIEQLKKREPERRLLRKLQRYCVSIYANQFEDLLRRGSLEEVTPDRYAVASPVDYDDRIGLIVDDALVDPETLIG